MITKNYGFVKPEIEASQYILGGYSKLPKTILQADGNWLPYIPTFESQATAKYDTYGCTVFGTMHALVILMKKIYGKDFNYSERFDYILAGIRPPGSDPHKVADIFHNNGVIEQSFLPMTDTYEQFIKPDPMTIDLITIGEEWLLDKEFAHEWVFTNSPSKEARVAILKEALQYGPVCISVTAWTKDVNGLYIDNGQPNCHWVCCVKLEEKNGEYYPIVIDSYEDPNGEHFIKKLHPDHHIGYAKRYGIVLKSAEEKKNKFIEILKLCWQWLMNIKKGVDLLPKESIVNSIVNKPEVINNPAKPADDKISKWDTPEKARKSFRELCDEMGVSVSDKNLLCQVLNCESGFKVNTVHKNNDSRHSTDFGSQKFGVAQFNDYWYKDVISPEDALNDPDKACRVFIEMFQKGRLKDWVCYSTGAYLKYKA